MGIGIEVISGSATNPGATLTALTMASGDSLTVKNTPLTAKIWLVSHWARVNTAGIFRIRSPRLHDNVQGIRTRVPVTDATPQILNKFQQMLIPQDTLIAEISGGAANIEQASMLLYYQDLPGINGRFASPEFVESKMVNIVTVETSHTTAASAGYQASASLTSSFDLMKANTDYALLGYVVDTSGTTVTMKGPDTGNLRVAGPCITTQRDVTSRWFQVLSEQTQLPCIPIINSANKNATTAEALHSSVITVVVNWIFAELRP